MGWKDFVMRTPEYVKFAIGMSVPHFRYWIYVMTDGDLESWSKLSAPPGCVDPFSSLSVESAFLVLQLSVLRAVCNPVGGAVWLFEESHSFSPEANDPCDLPALLPLRSAALGGGGDCSPAAQQHRFHSAEAGRYWYPSKHLELSSRLQAQRVYQPAVNVQRLLQRPLLQVLLR